MANPSKTIVLTFSITVIAGVIGTVLWMVFVPDVGEASMGAFFGGIVYTLLVLIIECIILAIIYRKQRIIAISLLGVPFLLALAYFGFIKLLESGF
jgi:putative copper export protein